jgi:hypothetical protein
MANIYLIAQREKTIVFPAAYLIAFFFIIVFTRVFTVVFLFFLPILRTITGLAAGPQCCPLNNWRARARRISGMARHSSKKGEAKAN